MRRVSVLAALAAAVLSFSLPAHSDAQAASGVNTPRLLKVVALSRHGVRSPTQSPETLSAWGSNEWPGWSVAPGHLTDRGEALIEGEWTGLRESLAFDGLLPASECPQKGSVFIYADNEERTLATARAMLDGLAPGCGMTIASGAKARDPLFHPVQGGLMPPPDLSARERENLAGELAAVRSDMDRRMAELSAILGPASPRLCPPGEIPCTLSDIPTSLIFPRAGSREGVALRGGLAIASTAAEVLLLESLEWPQRSQIIPAEVPVTQPKGPGTPVEQKAREIILAPRSDRPGVMPLPYRSRWEPAPAQVSHGDILVNPTTALHLLPVHTRVQNALQRFPAIARQEGMPLLLFMTEALAGTSPLKEANDADLVILSGHDTNIVNVAGLLGVHWNNAPFPRDSTPPGSMLVFRLWDTPQGRMVQASFQCQTTAALLSTDESVMAEAALRQEPLILPGSFAQTPAGPGLPADAFLASVRAMAGATLDAGLTRLFSDRRP